MRIAEKVRRGPKRSSSPPMMIRAGHGEGQVAEPEGHELALGEPELLADGGGERGEVEPHDEREEEREPGQVQGPLGGAPSEHRCGRARWRGRRRTGAADGGRGEDAGGLVMVCTVEVGLFPGVLRGLRLRHGRRTVRRAGCEVPSPAGSPPVRRLTEVCHGGRSGRAEPVAAPHHRLDVAAGRAEPAPQPARR